MKRLLLLLLCGFAFVFVAPVQAQESVAPQALNHETIPCPMSLGADEIDGETVVCGQIEVPEDWDNPAGRSILILYAVVKAQNRAGFSDPVIYFDGGPGATSLGVLTSLSSDFRRIRQTRDVIFYDQRGIRFSSELLCPPEAMQDFPMPELPADFDQAEIEEILSNITLDADPQRIVEAYGAIPSVNVPCGQYLAAQGVDVSEYSTHNSVLDALALMDALDYPAYNLYGISYGSSLAQEVMRYYDENTGPALPVVRSVVIDGVMPLAYDLVVNNAIVTANVVMDVLAECEADEACASAYPDIRQRAIDLLAAVEETPLVLADTTTIALPDLRTVMYMAVASKEASVYLPRLVDELARGVGDVYLRLQDGSLPATAVDAPADLSNPFDPITLEADALADRMRSIADEIEVLATQSRRMSDALASGDPLAKIFADQLIGSAELLGWNDQLRIGMSLSMITRVAPDRGQLVQLAGQLPELERNHLLGLIGLMDDEDILEVFTLLQDPAYQIDPINEIHHSVIHCNDRLSSYDIAASYDALRAFDAPQLIDVAAVDFAFESACVGYGLSYPSTAAPAYVSNSSGVPVLVSNGILDKATTTLGGKAAFEELQNARLVTFPQSEHGATLDSDCAKDVTNAFIMYPEAELNLSCIEGLKPVFVLPDASLPVAEQ